MTERVMVKNRTGSNENARAQEERSATQSAGGSTSELEAKVSDSIVLGTSEGLGILTTFYVLDGLTSGANLGEDFLDKTTAFETYRNAFSILNYDDDAAEVNGIIWFNEMGSLLSREMDALALKRRLGSGPAQERIPGMLKYPIQLINVLTVSRARGRKRLAPFQESSTSPQEED